MKLPPSKELVVAKKMLDLMADISLDVSMVGEYLANIYPEILYHRLELAVETAKEIKEG